MRNLLNDPEHRLALWQADRARQDYAEILDELDFVKLQLSRLPTRRDLAIRDRDMRTIIWIEPGGAFRTHMAQAI